MNTTTIINWVLWVIIIIWGIYELIQYFRRRRAAKVLTQEEFSKNLRKVQLIDVREKDEYNAGHILGARSLPYTALKQRMGEIRKDQPVYLYDQKQALSARAALKLRNAGYENIYILKGGYNDWTGKIKRKAR
ncbi:rhodanese-like domain-containing protein [Pisciglobus halotolerans]|uniref:Rhodanese-related sulfurtransferase n=1 Tax=Pisciglobus halotolerans TaxID=745365 RepID=A0A1I3CEZ1_9LACT|nr:rhodanese-like domain-containing protein [Pisciglobus halotolerans]SFH73097.1 Rhodanese-related sulfurtransferase [Pisciglobus halotolerans]